MELEQIDVIKLLSALVIGAVIGAEREYRSKSVGFRTMMLITIGSCLFSILAYKIRPNEPDRIITNIITGIGFLGAGAIFKDDNHITGVTTATAIWVAAALGMCVGTGYFYLAFFGMSLTLIVLVVLLLLEPIIDQANQIRRYKIVCLYQNKTLLHYETIFNRCNLKSTRGTQSRVGNEIVGNWVIQGAMKNHETLMQHLLNDLEIKEVDF